MPSRDDVTRLLSDLSAGKQGAGDALLPLVYDELHALAKSYMRHERHGHTLQTTALVHEAYMRLVDQSRVDWRGRTHFIAFASKVMRNLLIDHARRRASAKHGGDKRRVTLCEEVSPFKNRDLDSDQLLALNDALERLAEEDETAAQIVELRFFGGLKVDEVAALLGVSKRTVEGHWTHARAWLSRELSRTAAP